MILFWGLVGWFLGCTAVSTGTGTSTSTGTGAQAIEEQVLEVIAFGSCNRHDADQPLWEDIIAQEPDLWVWLGDNVYGDTRDMARLKSKYDMQKARIEYQALMEQCPVIGIWDDHDYGANDAGKEYAPKAQSRDLMFDFMGVPKDSPERKHLGAYQAHVFGPKGKRIKFLMLDARYFRDGVKRAKGVYQPNVEGTILGDQQWTWLEEQLSDTTVQLFVLASGIQVLSSQHRFEKWANFPNERKRLIDLVRDKTPPGVIFLSGDRHIGEISVLEVEGLPYPLVDITSSGLTHAFTGNTSEKNDLRLGEIVNELNFGVMRIDWSAGPKVTLELRVEGGEIRESFEVVF